MVLFGFSVDFAVVCSQFYDIGKFAELSSGKEARALARSRESFWVARANDFEQSSLRSCQCSASRSTANKQLYKVLP